MLQIKNPYMLTFFNSWGVLQAQMLFKSVLLKY